METNVLIIEDEADIREAMADALSQANMSVETAENGQVGLKKALELKPSIILLDLIMPIMDGHEVLKRLRQDQWGKDAKVIIMTAMDDVTNVASAHEGKIEDYIIKAHTSLDEVVKQVRLSLYS